MRESVVRLIFEKRKKKKRKKEKEGKKGDTKLRKIGKGGLHFASFNTHRPQSISHHIRIRLYGDISAVQLVRVECSQCSRCTSWSTSSRAIVGTHLDG